MIIGFIVTASFGYLSWSMIAMEINYRRASKIGIPLVRLPIDPMNIAWLILEPHFWKFFDRFPFTISWGTFGRYSRRGWHFQDKASSHLKYGPVWALVTPCNIYIYCADPDAIHEIFTRRADFLRPSKMYKLLEVYGPCISTASWTDWPRHRKVLATPFNENIMKFVWNESLRQANSMLQSWASGNDPSEVSSAKDTRTLSLNVLAATGFRKSYEFRASNTTETIHEQAGNEASSYRDALQTVLDNAILIMLIPARYLQLPFMPKSWLRVGRAAADFKKYMEYMLENETLLFKEGKAGSGSLMASFVRALDVSTNDVANGLEADQHHTKGLSVQEIFGNIFVINFAGHDTTANTLAFSMILLASHPEVQDWVGEELREVLQNTQVESWDYEKLYKKLKRCKAVLHETLRQYPPILALPKWTNDSSQTLQVGENLLVIPPGTGIMPSLLAVQTHPKYWKDPLRWNPARWISTIDSGIETNLASQLNAECVLTPARSTFFPWSDGPQNCPGQKFSQVEFVAVLAVLLHNHRVGIVHHEGENFEAAKKRALAITQDCNLELLLRMRDADQVRLMWKKV